MQPEKTVCNVTLKFESRRKMLSTVSMYGGDADQLQVHLYDARTGAEKLKLAGATSPLGAIAFTADEAKIAAASSNEITIWDVTSGRILSSLPLAANISGSMTGLLTGGAFPWTGLSSVTSLAFAPDGRSL